MERITKKRFLAAYDKFPPNKLVKFIFKYFSREVKEEDLWLKKGFITTQLMLFLIGMVSTILEADRIVILVSVIAFSGLLSLLVFSSFIAVIMNNLRIGKIRKELGGISKYKYNILAKKYL